VFEHYNGTIPEGSTIKILINHDDGIVSDCIANRDMKIEKNSLMLISGGLGSPVSIDWVEKVTSKIFIIHAWWQDCLVINNDTLYASYSDAS